MLGMIVQTADYAVVHHKRDIVMLDYESPLPPRC